MTSKASVQNHFWLFIGRFIKSEIASMAEKCLNIKVLSFHKQTYFKYK